MRVDRAGTDLPDVSGLANQQAGPTILRVLVGAHLRRLREASGISREKAGYAIRGSHSKISRLELGRSSFKLRDIADLLSLYGIRDEAERTWILELAEQSNAPGWWDEYRDVTPEWFEPYLGLEQGAAVIRGYDVQFVPGLLQTEQYARSVIRLGHPELPTEQVERRVALRLRRQRILDRPVPPRLWMIVDEGALRRRIGDEATMRGQLEHLTLMARLPQVTLQVLPFTAGHPLGGGPVTLLRFAEDELDDVVYLEQLAHAIYVNKPAELAPYWHFMNQLGVRALPPDESVEMIERMLAEG
ncbi:transcriptional regulator [Acrocarpospora phusangensis]|uniref:Transcriptional regulator n=1 Tax=Acrocarpospora phusangensis TaxID=1070424 RepID=A0A919QCR0_9ACTN|nr:helix-turn-helix transcriptional regulator [Acrocarpospora phusangensis]GIH26441.1 transcriptional regulator [Acrocarpospora phusangensis]